LHKRSGVTEAISNTACPEMKSGLKHKLITIVIASTKKF
jgi:hypothetical protein